MNFSTSHSTSILQNELGLVPKKTDRSFCLLFHNNKLVNLHGSYIDDLLRAGDEEYSKLCIHTQERFEMNREESLSVTFSGFNIQWGTDFPYSMGQIFYVKQLQETDVKKPFPAKIAQVMFNRLNDGARAH